MNHKSNCGLRNKKSLESGVWSLESKDRFRVQDSKFKVNSEQIEDQRPKTEDQIANQQSSNPQSAIRNPQSGYAMVALLALMAILMLAVIAVAPNLQREQQREREIEAIIRGEEVAEALREYARYNQGRLPNSLDDLLKGVPSKTKLGKNVQIVRPEALHDPLSSTGEWRVVRAGDPAFKAFQEGLCKYVGCTGALPPTTERTLQSKAPQLPPLGLESLNKTSDDKDTPPGGEDDSSNDGFGEIYGVVSRSRRASIVTYDGIARHDYWVFTPFYR